MKVSKRNQEQKTRMKVRKTSTAVKIDIASRIAKTKAYLAQTDAEFALNVRRANCRMDDFVGGALVGPIEQR